MKSQMVNKSYLQNWAASQICVFNWLASLCPEGIEAVSYLWFYNLKIGSGGDSFPPWLRHCERCLHTIIEELALNFSSAPDSSILLMHKLEYLKCYHSYEIWIEPLILLWACMLEFQAWGIFFQINLMKKWSDRGKYSLKVG